MASNQHSNADTASAASYLAMILKGIVRKSDDVRVEAREDSKGVLLVAHVHEEDLRYVIGKDGDTAGSIRKLLRCFDRPSGRTIAVKFHESSEHEATHRAEMVSRAAPCDPSAPVYPQTPKEVRGLSKYQAKKLQPHGKNAAPDLSTLEDSLGVEFKDKSLLLTALTHRSFLNEHTGVKEHNERLEYLGDAVLELATSDYLYQKYGDQPEGKLTRWRSAIVNGQNLGAVGERLGIVSYLRLSKGEARHVHGGGRSRDVILANAVEAIIGAIYLDSGFGEARFFIDAYILNGATALIGDMREWKTDFQDIAQHRFGHTPSYEVLSSRGPDHDKRFTVGVFVGETCVGKGDGASKLEAQTAAAKLALQSIDEWQDKIVPHERMRKRRLKPNHKRTGGE